MHKRKIIRNTLCVNRNEMINYIVNEYIKFAQKKYKTRNNWARKVILWELCKKLKFEHSTKW